MARHELSTIDLLCVYAIGFLVGLITTAMIVGHYM